MDHAGHQRCSAIQGESQARIARSARGQDGAGGGTAVSEPPLSAAGHGLRCPVMLRRVFSEPGKARRTTVQEPAQLSLLPDQVPAPPSQLASQLPAPIAQAAAAIVARLIIQVAQPGSPAVPATPVPAPDGPARQG